ncbi:serine/threonine protein kinase [Plesiocystis pacifica SIR-1]|uniref:non-specific serine/threonine protein kinase n=2 Tax=Plesiocystis pacifica TaxID=191768 RepID=A6G7X4_9BACT|nr:serine/threonine protein kinase [Plesiocystis pacifica SIR-1]
MGRVYLGEHVTLRKRVAIKVLKQEFCHDRTNVERFLQEARAASMIRHENIVDIMDFGQVPGGSVFFVMELLEGSDLSDLLKEGGALPWMRTRNILLQVVRALKAAHESGIIHRDMKPANVYLIKRSSATDYVKVLDFGIAKVDDSTSGLTRTGAVFGTAGYMAPEQACGDPVDSRTDVYAVGCMMFEMLTGRLPFPGTNFMRVLTQHMNEPAPLPRDVAPNADISDEVERIIMTALEKNQEDRFRDMAALEQAIAQANGEVATMPPQNKPRVTEKGTMVLDEDGPNPFAGMTPGQPPPGYQGGGSDATMMLDGMGGVSLGDEAEGDGATMMLDMGGATLGADAEPADGATMMLDMSGSGSGAAVPGPVPGTMPPGLAGPAPSPAPKQEDNKKLYMMIGGGVLGLILLIVIAVVAFGGKKDSEEVADASAEADGGDAKADGAAADAGAEPAADEGAAADAGAAAADAGAAAADAGAAEGGAAADAGAADAGAADAGPEVAAADAGAAADEGAADDAGAEGDDGLVLEDEPAENPDPVKKPPTATKVKASLSAADVTRGLKRVKSKVSSCKSKGGLPGMKVKVNMMIVDGKVKSASPRPPHSNTPVGKCVAGAVKKARFPKAKQTKITDHTFTL